MRQKMGMTIDEHIGVIEDLKSTMNVCMPEPEKTEICTSLSEAMEIMRKYQKIEEIVKFGDANELGFEYVGEKITEVMEDG